MNRFLPLLMLLAGACSDVSAPAVFPVVAGDYRLEQVNGHPLPFLFPGSTLQIYAGRLTLKADHSFTWSLCYAAQQSPCAVEEVDQGGWTATTNTAILSPSGTNPQKRLTATTAETLRWPGAGGLTGYVLDFRRQ